MFQDNYYLLEKIIHTALLKVADFLSAYFAVACV